ncbi:MAG: hypothetical protein H7Z37_16470 [Pyrinomonadaceae bacterium]|nr:hypothetical protein [Pyrinomonadaceae bacterium]
MSLINNTLQSVGNVIIQPLNLSNQTAKPVDNKEKETNEAEIEQTKDRDKSSRTLTKHNAKAAEKSAEKASEKADDDVNDEFDSDSSLKSGEKHGEKSRGKSGEKLSEKSEKLEESGEAKHEKASERTSEKNVQKASVKAEVSHQNKSVEVEVSSSSTSLEVVHKGLSKHAENSGLPKDEQTKFINKHTEKFVAHTLEKGAEKLLKTAGDLRLLQTPTPIINAKHQGKKVEIELGDETLKDLHVRLSVNNGNNGNNLHLKFKANVHHEERHENRHENRHEGRENGQSDADFHLSMQFGINRSTSQRATIEARMQAQENHNQTVKADLKLQTPVIQLPKSPNSLPQTPQTPLSSGGSQANLHASVHANPTNGHTRNPIHQTYSSLSTPQVHEIKNTILNKVATILQTIIRSSGDANGSEQTGRRGEISNNRNGENREISSQASVEGDSSNQTLEKILYSGGRRGEGEGEQGEQTEQDNALLTSAFGVSSDSGAISRKKHGDGLLLDFVNYGGTETPVKLDPKVFMASLLKVLQNGSEAGFNALQDAAGRDLSPATFDGIKQISAKLDADGTKHLVYGVVTLNVMNQEIVERLSHISGGSQTGLSDDALASLQKAHNSLRDHLTSSDLVGALGDVKGSPVSVSGSNYNFLPEVQEALNSLRDARSRIMSEMMHVKNDASGATSQQRFSMEADALLEVTRRIEDYLKIK